MSDGVIGLGTLLKIGDGATPEVFTAIAGVKDINGPVLSREFAELAPAVRERLRRYFARHPTRDLELICRRSSRLIQGHLGDRLQKPIVPPWVLERGGVARPPPDRSPSRT